MAWYGMEWVICGAMVATIDGALARNIPIKMDGIQQTPSFCHVFLINTIIFSTARKN